MDITEQQQELIESDNVTPELASQLLWQAMNDGDTTQTVETGSEPDTTQAGNDKKSEETAGGTQQNQEQQAQQQQMAPQQQDPGLAQRMIG